MKLMEKKKYDILDLLEIVKLLRSPGGCPWDIKQTHQSIKKNFIEETYEVVEAIDLDDKDLLKEELGDVLLQIIFHSQIEDENSNFSFSDVVNGICKKLIVRHPHVFADVKAETSEEVLENWDKIKMQTKAQTSQSQVMKSVSRALPALMRSQKVQSKAAKVGFDFNNVSDAMNKISEETQELKKAIECNDFNNIEEELGDLLFSVVNVSRKLNFDSESTLYKACDKFISRFEKLENIICNTSLDITGLSENELDGLWREVKG